MLTMTPLTFCKTCHHPVVVDDVYKDKQIVDAPEHIVLFYKCSSCGRKDKIAATNEVWDGYQQKDFFIKRNISKEAIRFALDLDLFDTVAELQALWRSFKNPPILEDRIGKCNCDDCKRRLYAQG
jgi:hypothetical protein